MISPDADERPVPSLDTEGDGYVALILKENGEQVVFSARPTTRQEAEQTVAKLSAWQCPALVSRARPGEVAGSTRRG